MWEMRDDNLLMQWFSQRDLSKNTRLRYSTAVKDYCRFVGKTPTELLEEAELEEKTVERKRNRKINDYLTGYKMDLEEDEMAPNTIRAKVKAIVGFYKHYDVQVPEMSFQKGDLSLQENRGRLLTKEDISLLMAAANLKTRAMISVMAMTGMSQAEIRSLTYKTILDAVGLDSIEELIENKVELCKVVTAITIVRKKVNYRYITFLPPETMEEIINYTILRMHNQNPKMRPQNPNDIIFVNRSGKPVSGPVVSGMLKNLGKEVGFNVESQQWAFWRPHAMRKYFISTIINKTGDTVLAHFCAGHTVDRITGAYWFPDEEDLKLRYIEALPHLSVRGYNLDLAEEDMQRRDERTDQIYNDIVQEHGYWRK